MVISAPLLGDDKLVGGAGLVVMHLEVNGETPELEAMHNAVVGCDAVAVVLGLRGFYEDHIIVRMVCQHNIVAVTARADGGATHVVRVELANGFNNDKQFL